MAVKIEQDADYQYFIVSTFNRKIDDDYQELAAGILLGSLF